MIALQRIVLAIKCLAYDKWFSKMVLFLTLYKFLNIDLFKKTNYGTCDQCTASRDSRYRPVTELELRSWLIAIVYSWVQSMVIMNKLGYKWKRTPLLNSLSYLYSNIPVLTTTSMIDKTTKKKKKKGRITPRKRKRELKPWTVNR